MSEQAVAQDLQAQFDTMRAAQLAGGIPSAELRKQRLQKCIELLVDNQDALADALDKDYGGRSPYLTLMSEVMIPVGHCKQAIKNLDKWMKPERRSAPVPMGLFGSRAKLVYQPKGVVGVMSPWNFPLAMVFNPLCNALAAGNRVMIKMSEFNPLTAELVQELIAKYFSPDEVVVITGGPEVGAAFCELPLNHILFTGASGIGRMVMASAAKNLTPVTLELGGKSPVIVSDSADIAKTAETIMIGKTNNSGQACVSPDYVFVPEKDLETFIEASRKMFQSLYPSIAGNGDLATVINDRHYDRIKGYLDEAQQAGVRVENLGGDATESDDRRLAVRLVVNPGEDLAIMQEEIFGPAMIVKTYTDLPACVAYINSRPSPLALYYFGKDKDQQQWVLDNTLSGGVSINETMMHVACDDLPFGGVGNSGMGNYHGREGFKTFSHARGVFTQGWVNLAKLAGTLPPYKGEKLKKMLAGQIKK